MLWTGEVLLPLATYFHKQPITSLDSASQSKYKAWNQKLLKMHLRFTSMRKCSCIVGEIESLESLRSPAGPLENTALVFEFLENGCSKLFSNCGRSSKSWKRTVKISSKSLSPSSCRQTKTEVYSTGLCFKLGELDTWDFRRQIVDVILQRPRQHSSSRLWGC